MDSGLHRVIAGYQLRSTTMISKARGKFALLFVSLLYQTTTSSFCGSAAIPFSFESLPDGQPVLGCARPKCFGWNAEEKPAGALSTFFRINNRPDGYFRKNVGSQSKPVSKEDAQYFHPQVATCSPTYDSENCDGDNQWVGGIGPLINVSGLPISVQCCTYEPLRNSSDRGVAVVNPGQIVIGGEVLNDERQYAFDYISDIKKRTKADGSVSYDVAVRRLPCIPYPNELTIDIEKPVLNEILNRFEKVEKQIKPSSAQAFQVPTQLISGQSELQEIGTKEQIFNIGDQQLITDNQGVGQIDKILLQPASQEQVQIIQGPFAAEPDAVVEEVQPSPGFPLPLGQMPTGLLGQPVIRQEGSLFPGIRSGCAGGGCFCFSADTVVTLSNGEIKRMDELQLDDQVLTANGSQVVYANVDSWVHKMPKTRADFHRIELSDGKTLKVTAKHYIYKAECTDEDKLTSFEKINYMPVYAESVAVGDCLYVLVDKRAFEQRRVRKVDIVEDVGLYAPMTSNEDIIVNGILASCHNILSSKVIHRSSASSPLSLHGFDWIFGKQEDGEIQADLSSQGTSFLAQLIEHVLPVSVHSF